MVPRLSIVIPVAADVDRLEETLVSVLENRPAACEVLVVHPQCYDDPYDLGDEVRFVEAAPRRSLVDLVNLGIDAARADVVHLLACGARVEEGWVEPALTHFARPDVHAVSPAVLDARDPSRLLAAGVAYGCGGRRVLSARRHRFHDRLPIPPGLLGPTLAAAFYRRRTLAGLRGLDRNVGSQLADLDTALTLGHLGCRIVFEPGCRVLSEWQQVTPKVGTLRQGWCSQRIYWRHACTQSWADRLVAHPLLAAGELLADAARLRWPRLIGRLAGNLCLARDYGHADRIFERLGPNWSPSAADESAGGDSLDDARDEERPTVPLVPPRDEADCGPQRQWQRVG